MVYKLQSLWCVDGQEIFKLGKQSLTLPVMLRIFELLWLLTYNSSLEVEPSNFGIGRKQLRKHQFLFSPFFAKVASFANREKTPVIATCVCTFLENNITLLRYESSASVLNVVGVVTFIMKLNILRYRSYFTQSS